jgi:hypothetical protein
MSEVFVGLYGWWADPYLYSDEALSMWNMYILQFIIPTGPTSLDDLNDFFTRIEALSSRNVKVVLDLHGFGMDGGWFWQDSNIDYAKIDAIFELLEPIKDSVYAVTLYEENPVQKASTLKDLYNYIKTKWPWASVYQWPHPYTDLHSFISDVGDADGYVLNPYSLRNPAFTNYLMPFVQSGKPVICLPYAAVELSDRLAEQIPVLHDLQIPAVFYAIYDNYQIPDAVQKGINSIITVKWLEIQIARAALIASDSATYEEYLRQLKAMSTTPSGCFIATACYGSPTHTRVCQLREIKDKLVAKSKIASFFYHLYYVFSPSIALKIENMQKTKKAIRTTLEFVWRLFK